MVISSIESDRFVFVEECSSNTSLAPLYGWSRGGERVHQKAPRNWGKNITLVSSISKESGMGASLVVEGSTNATVLHTYLQELLCPTLKRGQVVVMDNLSAHKGEGKGTDRGKGMRARLPAALLTGLQSHRKSLLQAQELPQGCVRS
jgi:DDE superfamily endonuclease